MRRALRALLESEPAFAGSGSMMGEAGGLVGRRWLAVILLAAACAVSLMDRSMLNLLIPPIKQSMRLSDTDIGVLTGAGNGIVYALAGLYMGRLADRRRRRDVIVWGIFAWSGVMALCGLARNYGELLTGRIALAIGEATLTPAAFSIVADLFPGRQLVRAMSVLTAGANLGPGLSLLYGSLIIRLLPTQGAIELPLYGALATWQAVLILASLPGLVVLLAIWIMVDEPARIERAPLNSAASEPSSSEGIFAYIRANAWYYAPLFSGVTLSLLYYAGVMAWTPTYLVRAYGWTLQETGFWLGIIVVATGVPGTLFGGWLAERLIRAGYREGLLRMMLGAILAALPFSAVTALRPGPTVTLIAVAIYIFCAMAANSGGPVAVQVITPNRLRGQATAIYIMIINIVSITLGPLIVGLLTDRLFHDDRQVGQSLALVAAVTLIPTALIYRRWQRAFAAALSARATTVVEAVV